MPATCLPALFGFQGVTSSGTLAGIASRLIIGFSLLKKRFAGIVSFFIMTRTFVRPEMPALASR